MRGIRALSFVILASLSGLAQETPKRLEFEVASIRHSPDQRPESVSLGLHMDGAQARINYLAIRDYIAMAYRLRPFQINGPEWLPTERYDLSAKLPAGTTSTQIPDMLQTLLVERFQLKFHHDQKELPVYALTLGKGPLKLKESAPDAPDAPPRKSVDVAATGSAAGVSVNLGNGSFYTFGNDKFEAGKMSMDTLTRLLASYMDRPILNLTGLTANYDFTLDLTPEDYRAMLIRIAVNNGVVLPPQALQIMDATSLASLYDAIQKLGLKLEARKAPVDVMVIDQLSKTPTEN